MRSEIEELATLHHIAQSFAYYMGYRYHKRRKRSIYKLICVVGITFHAWSSYKHLTHKEVEVSKQLSDSDRIYKV